MNILNFVFIIFSVSFNSFESKTTDCLTSACGSCPTLTPMANFNLNSVTKLIFIILFPNYLKFNIILLKIKKYLGVWHLKAAAFNYDFPNTAQCYTSVYSQLSTNTVLNQQSVYGFT